MEINYARAYTEVIKILECLPKEEYNKIPKEDIDFYKRNMDTTYEYYYDPTKPPSEQKISREANAIIVSIFRDYFLDDAKKDVLNKILRANETRYQEKLREKYSIDKIFKNKK